MISRQRIATYGIPTAAAATIVAAALLTPWGSRDKPMPPTIDPEPVAVDPASGKNQIDVVFAVDTTGSMGGLLDGAKRTVWSIATHIRKTDPNANLRIGLVAYRDVGDDYVTKPYLLNGDLDAVYSELSTYQASGGGDTPENVDAALHDALNKMKWRASAQKMIFLVGDAPPSSRGDVPTYDVLAKEAGRRGIILNTIRCGHDSETAMTFQKIASLGGGEFSSISQDGGVQQIATPYDDKLAELSSTVDRTTIVMGSDGLRSRHAAKMAVAEAAPAPSKADRASFYATKKGKPGRGRMDYDLVGGVATGKVKLDAVAPQSLPPELRGKDKAELKAEIDRRVAARAAAQKEIAELTKKRDAYLDENAKEGEGGFDDKVKATVEKQLKMK